MTVSAGSGSPCWEEQGGQVHLLPAGNGVLRPWEGTVYFLGHPVGAGLATCAGAWDWYGTRTPQILGGTVEEEISFGRQTFACPGGSGPRVEAALEQLQITHLRARAPPYLSGGEKSRSPLPTYWPWSRSCCWMNQPPALIPGTARSLRKL
ncbi:MAG: hypothetical protein ACLTYN_03785 [Dysosmobacter welbionis]